MIELKKIDIADAERLRQMQETAFSELLRKYKDYDTSPACESLETIQRKISTSDFYYIEYNEKTVGAIRIVNKGESCRVSPVFIMPDFRDCGYASAAMRIAETLYPDVRIWELDTIMQEDYLVGMYERLGFIPTGETYDIKNGMTIIFMQKTI